MHGIAGIAPLLIHAATEQVFGHLKNEFHRGCVFDSYERFKAELDACIGTPDDARYDSRDTPRRSSGACPSRSRAVF